MKVVRMLKELGAWYHDDFPEIIAKKYAMQEIGTDPKRTVPHYLKLLQMIWVNWLDPL